MYEGFLGFAAVFVELGEVLAGGLVVGLEIDGVFEEFEGFVFIANLAVHEGQVVVEFGVGGGESEGFLEGGLGLGDVGFVNGKEGGKDAGP